MTQEGHDTLHSLVPIYSNVSKILTLSIDGLKSGKYDLFIDIRDKAERAIEELMKLENELKSDTYKRRKYDK